jgi:hypothetical protein
MKPAFFWSEARTRDTRQRGGWAGAAIAQEKPVNHLLCHFRHAYQVEQTSLPATPAILVTVKKKVPSELSFHDWLVLLARERGLTQRALADLLTLRNTMEEAERRFSAAGSRG